MGCSKTYWKLALLRFHRELCDDFLGCLGRKLVGLEGDVVFMAGQSVNSSKCASDVDMGFNQIS